MAALVVRIGLAIPFLSGTVLAASAGLFSYYETPLPSGLVTGPSNWHALVDGSASSANQCGGTGHATGFGQSPIVVPHFPDEQPCDTDLSHYIFQEGDCSYENLQFEITNDGVKVSPQGGACTMGRMKIPGSQSTFRAAQFHIHTMSEHAVNGKFYPAELHVVHLEESGDTAAVFGMFLDTNEDDQDHVVFEYFLRGWEAKAHQAHEYCALQGLMSKDMSEDVSPMLPSRQLKVECPAVGHGINRNHILVDDAGIPLPKKINFPNFDKKFPNLYHSLVTKPDYGIYTYRGGLTTPPCTEMVNWNLLDTPMIISQSQMDRLYKIVLCYVDTSSCRHATIANEFGGTNRPPQPLNGRTVLHRCSTGPSDSLRDPLPPPYKIPDEVFSGTQNPHYSVLFPCFVMVIAAVVIFLVTQYVSCVSHLAVLFLVGTFMGIGIAAGDLQDQLSTSLRQWQSIDSQVLSLVFLPGVLFQSALSLHSLSFQQSYFRCAIMGMPFVLSNTCLTALLAYYALPYDWSFDLSLAFGAILSATADPWSLWSVRDTRHVPLRLQTQLTSESLFNSGASTVLFAVFARRFLYDLYVPISSGSNWGSASTDAASVIGQFFRLWLGAIAIGIAFAVGLIAIISSLRQKWLWKKDGVHQALATIAVAYLTFYVAESVCDTSGTVAVVTCGIVTNLLGRDLIDDTTTMEKSWLLLRNILNVIVFALGGVMWGTVISNEDPGHTWKFSGSDWGYLLFFYLMVNIIRWVLVTVGYPVFVNAGLHMNWKENSLFSLGGLRGPMSVVLALSLSSLMNMQTPVADPRRNFTAQLYGFTGGIILLTLVFNGSLSGYLFQTMFSPYASDEREKILSQHRKNLIQHVLGTLLEHLTRERYHGGGLDFAVVRERVPVLKGLAMEDLKTAMIRKKDITPTRYYKSPRLDFFEPFLSQDMLVELNDVIKVTWDDKLMNLSPDTETTDDDFMDEAFDESMDRDPLVRELRMVFMGLVRCEYQKRLQLGEMMSSSNKTIWENVQDSLAMTVDRVSLQEPLRDWEPCTLMTEDIGVVSTIRRMLKNEAAAISLDEELLKHKVHLAMVFIEAHKNARCAFQEEFGGPSKIPSACRKVLKESVMQSRQAEGILQDIDSSKLILLLSHVLSDILSDQARQYVQRLIKHGLVNEQEGETLLKEWVHQKQVDPAEEKAKSAGNDPEVSFQDEPAVKEEIVNLSMSDEHIADTLADNQTMDEEEGIPFGSLDETFVNEKA